MKERMTEEKALLLIAGVDAALKKCDFNYEDKATYQLLQRGDTDGIFFLEGAFNQFDLCQLKPSNLQQLTAACAFSHPLTNDLIYKYLKNREIRSGVSLSTNNRLTKSQAVLTSYWKKEERNLSHKRDLLKKIFRSIGNGWSIETI